MSKKVVRLTESDLREIVAESIKTLLPETTAKSSDGIFDLNEIPMDILDKGWTRYHPYLYTIDHENPLANRFIEEATDLRKAIMDTVPIGEEQFKI